MHIFQWDQENSFQNIRDMSGIERFGKDLLENVESNFVKNN